MSMTTHPADVPDLERTHLRQREALERIAATCDTVNFPPDIIVTINVLAHEGLGEARSIAPTAHTSRNRGSPERPDT